MADYPDFGDCSAVQPGIVPFADSAIGCKRGGNGHCNIFLALFCFENRSIHTLVAKAAAPEHLRHHAGLPPFLPGLHLLGQPRQLYDFCRCMAGGAFPVDCPPQTAITTIGRLAQRPSENPLTRLKRLMHVLIIPSWYPETPDDIDGIFFASKRRRCTGTASKQG